MTVATLRTAIVRTFAWMLTGMLAAAMVCALIVIGTSTALRHHGVQVGVVLSGSMTPTFRAGDAVLITPRPAPSELRVGQIITFHAPGEDRLTTHRIHALIPRPDGLFIQTKGDANPAPDANFTPASDVVGIMGRSIPKAGQAVAFYSQPRGRLIVLGVPLTLLLMSQIAHLWRTLRDTDDTDSDGSGSAEEVSVSHSLEAKIEPAAAQANVSMSRRDRSARLRLSRRARTAAVGLAVTAATGAGVATTTGAVFASTAVTRTTFASANDFCASNAYASEVETDSPDISWTHDSAATDAASTYGAASTGSVAYGASGAVACSTGAAFGTNGAISADSKSNGWTSFSVETWIRTTGTPAAQIMGFGDKRAAQGSSTTRDRVLYITSTGKAAWTVASSSNRTTVTTPQDVTDGQWHHLVATYSPTSVRLYLDGTLAASASSPTQPADWKGYWRAGQDSLTGLPSTSGAGSLNATLDETAVYGTTLTASRVAAHYTASGR